MSDSWNDQFRQRMSSFERRHHGEHTDVSLSIKIRVSSGCFHREHSPVAYEIIDEHLAKIPDDRFDFAFEEHESGPEILIFVAATTAVITLSKSVIDLVTTIVKARAESVRQGDRPSEPIELIVRRVAPDGAVREERIVRFTPVEPVDRARMEQLLTLAATKLLSKDDESEVT